LHGWVLDPQDKITARVIQNQSYNQIINTLVEYRSILDRTVNSYKSSKLSEKENNEIETKVVSESEIKGDISVPAGEEVIIRGEELTAVSEESPGEYDSSDIENLKIQANNQIVLDRSCDKDLTDSSPYVIITSSSDHMEAPDSRNETSLIDLNPLTDSNDNQSKVQMHENIENNSILGSDTILNPTEVTEEMNNIPVAPMEQIMIEKCKSEKLKNDLSVEDIKLFNEGEIIESFLALTASQLTYLGLLSLHQIIRERQLAVFFRNNHFSTIFRNNGQLYLLVTDQVYYLHVTHNEFVYTYSYVCLPLY
jgi:hypothetical protein